MDPAVGIVLVAIPLRQLVSVKLGSQRFTGKSGDRTVAPGVRPQRSDLFAPPGKATSTRIATQANSPGFLTNVMYNM